VEKLLDQVRSYVDNPGDKLKMGGKPLGDYVRSLAGSPAELDEGKVFQ
jgi:hypothetical protein